MASSANHSTLYADIEFPPVLLGDAQATSISGSGIFVPLQLKQQHSLEPMELVLQRYTLGKLT